MSDIAIRVENLSKQYRIGGPQGRYKYKSLREELIKAVQAPLRRLSSAVRGESTIVSNETIWALKDVSFEVKRGQVVGIIGRNGAGKTTLLKILSRITEPTEGYAEIHGRVSSLLEVGTGFHPELTGRENIYLNGAILGMKRAEIERKFDEIVAFSEVEKFIDTPMKRYSSGMYVRLAFAVAAHLEPEILLVDEVLAVGDVAFQQKCLGKMGNVAKEGRTVLFVSHNMAAISALCSRACLLNNGKLIENGEVRSVIGRYLETIKSIVRVPLTERADRGGNGRVRFTDVRILNSNGEPVETVASGQNVRISIGYRAMDGSVLENVKVGIGIYSLMGTFLLYCSNELVGSSFRILPPEGRVSCTIPQLPLTPGQYYLNLSFLTNGILADWVIEAAILRVVEGDFFGTGRLPPATHGGFLTSQRWDASS